LQRENRPEAIGIVTAVGQLHASGMTVDWPAFSGVDLPSEFQVLDNEL